MKTKRKVFIPKNEVNKKLINDYLYFYKTKKPNSSKHTLRSIEQSLSRLSVFLETKTIHKSLKEANEQNMLNFFNNKYYVTEGSYNIIGINIIPFYRRLYGLDKRSRPNNLNWFETTSERTKRKNNDPHRKEKLFISNEDYKKMMGFYKDIYGQYNAILETYYLSGFRPEELVSMKIQDVKEDKDNVVWVSCPKSKTYPREISLCEYPENLMRYIGNHPEKNNKNAPLWFITRGSKDLKPISIKTISKKFKEMREKLGLKDTFTLKSFRKTRATIFFSSDNPKINNDSFIAKYLGWSTHTVSSRRQEYNLMDKSDLKKAILNKPIISKSYDTIKKERDKLEKRYIKEIDELKNEIKLLEKNLSNKIDEIRRLKFKEMEELEEKIKKDIYEEISREYSKKLYEQIKEEMKED